VAKYGHVSAVAAFDSGNLLAVATALHERWPGKPIMIAGDDDHRLENNPGRAKAVEAAAAVKGLAVFPQLDAQQRERGLTDFNDLVLENRPLAGQPIGRGGIARENMPNRKRARAGQRTIHGGWDAGMRQIFAVLFSCGGCHEWCVPGSSPEWKQGVGLGCLFYEGSF